MIYIACPANVVTGGPTLAHQMCYELVRTGHEAQMFYYGQDRRIEEWKGVEDSPYAKYNVSCANSIEEIDRSGNVVVVPEMAIPIKDLFSRASVHIWWMSVDGYLVSLANGVGDINLDIAYFMRKDVFHFVQSRYAYDFLCQDIHIEDDRIFYLTDYIDETYLEPCNMTAQGRSNVVFYNYTKCGQVLPIIMGKHPEIDWFPIRGMTIAQIQKSFREGKVYVDFGSHPGKDRLPREAASCGLCVLTNRFGSAGNEEDVPIRSEYKFVDPLTEMENVVEMIQSCLDEYDRRIGDFENYRMRIRGERERFCEEVRRVAAILEKE